MNFFNALTRQDLSEGIGTEEVSDVVFKEGCSNSQNNSALQCNSMSEFNYQQIMEPRYDCKNDLLNNT